MRTITDEEAFAEYFGAGTCFWSSEDGYRTDLVIRRFPDAIEHEEQERARMALFREYFFVKGADWTKHLLEGFVHEEVVEGWHDGPSHGENEKEKAVWTFSKEPTPYPVWIIAL